MEESAEIEVVKEIGKQVVARETTKEAAERPTSRLEALFQRHRQPLSLEEAIKKTEEPTYLQIKPSTREISPYTHEKAKETIENIRDIFTLVCQYPQLLENFSRMAREGREAHRRDTMGVGGKSQQECFNEWLEEVSEKAKGFGVTLELNDEERRRACEEMWRDTNLSLYFEDLPKPLFELRSGRLVTTAVPIKVIERFADQYFQTVYMVSLVEGAKNLMREYYPELVPDWPYKVDIETIGGEGAHYRTLEERTHRIAIQAPIKSISWIDWAHACERTEEVHMEDNISLKRSNKNFHSLLHELAHAKSHEITGEPVIQRHDPDIKRREMEGLDGALDEGFAVVVELHILNRLIEDAGRWGLEEKDINDFEWLRRNTLSLLWRKKDHYTDGTLKIFHGILKRGGVKGAMEFLQKVNWRECAKIGEGTPEYEAALEDPSKIPMKQEAPATTS